MSSGGASSPRLRRGIQPVAAAGRKDIALVDGLTFALSDEAGDMPPGPFGLLVRDTRHLSRLALTVAGVTPAHLVTGVVSATSARFHASVDLEDLGPDAPLEVERRRSVRPDGLDEEIVLRLWAVDRARVQVVVETACDFADIFDVRRMRLGRGRPPPSAAPLAEDDGLSFATPDGALSTRVDFDRPPDALGADGRASWRADLTRGGSWRLAISVRADGDAEGRSASAPRARRGGGSRWASARTRPPWRAPAGARPPIWTRSACPMPSTPRGGCSPPGSPWFVALFGRDSPHRQPPEPGLLDAARMAETLEALASRQGRRPTTPETTSSRARSCTRCASRGGTWLGSGTQGGSRPYYGSVDATPLFLIVSAPPGDGASSRGAARA